MSRPLRSLLIGDCDHYFSPYIFGVAQACARLGIWHSQISIRLSASEIEKRARDVRPDLLWTHMLLWPPKGRCTRDQLIEICRRAKKSGAHVLLHDGDVKERTRYPQDLSDFMSLALCNHEHDRTAWRIPRLYWPYAAFPQDELAAPVPELACEVAFAGTLGKGVYGERTRLIDELQRRAVDVRVFNGHDGNTMLRTPEVAASALSVLGFGRPGTSGWLDTRVTQYPGAGGILLHDDVRGLLDPDVHYVHYHSGDADSVVEGVEFLRTMSEGDRHRMRLRAMQHVQTHHSWTARVQQVLDELELR